MSWLTAFALTQSIEVPTYWLGTRHMGLQALERLGIGFGCSALTHPVVWFLLWPWLFPTIGFWPFFAVAETFAVAGEALYLRVFGVKHPVRLSLLANSISATVGLAVHAFL